MGVSKVDDFHNALPLFLALAPFRFGIALVWWYSIISNCKSSRIV